MNFAEQFAEMYPRSKNIWDILSSFLGGKSFGALTKRDICDLYKYAGALSKTRRFQIDNIQQDFSESDAVVYWLIKNFEAYKKALENWDFKKQEYGRSHNNTVPHITPEKLPPEKLRQVRYEKYIEMWLYDKFKDDQLPAIVYDANLKKLGEASIGECKGYEQYLKSGSGEAIDLITVQRSGNKSKVYLLELKSGFSQETLLRCLLEAYTYAKMVKPEWRKDLFQKLNVNDCDAQIVICPLFFDVPTSRQSKEFWEAVRSPSPAIKDLARKIEEIERNVIKVEFALLDPESLPGEIQEWLNFECQRKSQNEKQV